MQWNDLNKVLNEHWHILTCSKHLKDIVGPRPYLVAKRAGNLNDTLVQSKFIRTASRNWLTDLPELKGMFPCGHCGICRYVEWSDMFTDSNGANRYSIKQMTDKLKWKKCIQKIIPWLFTKWPLDGSTEAFPEVTLWNLGILKLYK